MNTGFHLSADPELLEVYRAEAEEHLASIGDALLDLQKNPVHGDALGNIRRRIHTLKGAAATVGILPVANLAHRLEDLLDHIHLTGTAITLPVLHLVSLGTRVLARMTREGDDETSRVRDISRLIDEVLSTDARGKEPHREEGRVETGAHAPVAAIATPRVVRVARSHLEELTQTVSDLSLHHSRMDREQRKLITRIQSALNSMRMLPLRMLGPRLHRIVRATAQHENKKAALILQGEDIQVDTTVIEQIVDPLMHLLRNAVGHGIELPAVRKALGKPEQGTIEVRARTEDNAILLEIEDDGAGFNFPAIRERAVSKGLLPAGQAELTNHSELCRIALSPGFSTARAVSQVSGRGVGMDVVQDALRTLQGSISIHSVPGKRTVITLRMPAPSHPKEKTNRSDTDPIQTPALSVMVVDDSPSMRRINASLIRKAGWVAITATDGLDALDKLQRSSKLPDAIVLDVEMPRMDGFGLLTQLRNLKDYDDIPIILLTSRESEPHRRKAEELAVSVYLIKPCYGEVLINHLRSLTA